MTVEDDRAVVDALVDAVEFCYDQEWTDGLPVVPCTPERLDAFLAHTDRAPDEVLLAMPQIGRECTVRMAALNAAMAGCRPEYLPVVLAVWDSLNAEGYTGKGIWQSTTGTAPLILVNGPVRAELGVNSRGNVFGSGFRANATIGRAIRLAAINVFGLRPHALDQATQGTPAKYTCCIGENQEESPWPAFHEEFGFGPDDSTVTAMTMRSVSQIEARHTSDARQLLRDFAGTVARTGALLQRTISTCLVLSPEHAHLLAGQGFDKPAIREFVFEAAQLSREELDAVGKTAISSTTSWRLPSDHPEAVPDERVDPATDFFHVLTSPDAVQVVVAGASNSGVSAVVDTFGPRGDRPPLVAVPRPGAAGRADPQDLRGPLGGIVATLERDGFAPTWDVTASGDLTFRIGAGSADCSECLVPKSMIEAMLTDALAGTSYRVAEVVMPTEG
ncbi:hypothetical protein [Pseudonocardia zijingensis]|uniref:Thioredoxin n=1 Tax=Pseudonocardia zijingensis TaxID=153376 RepID=A0ABP3YVL1_9PSEU